ncbi:MAG: D-hexose-6-phosphate mutarotase [Lentisphaeria bacterium]|nr:D-hexose-6-phosphate mutarotase [Lentisphaeria bacterium]
MNADLLLENARWQAEISLHGGQLLRAYNADSPSPVIWLGERAMSGPEQAIRGGVPICWPWFGVSPVAGRPVQGFARTCQWKIERLESDSVQLILPEDHVPAGLRDFPFELRSEIRLGEALELTLQMKNTGSVPVGITLALHTYLAVGDIEAVRLYGLGQVPFTVKGGPEQAGEPEPLTICGECCRLYAPHSGTVRIDDPVLDRTLTIEKENSHSTLIWNPGAERAARIADLSAEEYRQFICVEANRSEKDILTIPPEDTISVRQRIRLGRGVLPGGDRINTEKRKR